jgi:hypothetical protein
VALGLCETIGDDVKSFEVVAVPEVGAVHFDVLGARCGHTGGALPGHDAVGLAANAIRFLGVDTPELAFAVPGRRTRRRSPTRNGRRCWPIRSPTGPTPSSSSALHAILTEHTGPGTAANHAEHAEAAEKTLGEAVAADLDTFAGGDPATFVFFLRYAKEVIDRYGRPLSCLTVNVWSRKLSARSVLRFFATTWGTH